MDQGAIMSIRLICIDQSLKNGPGHLLAGGSYQIGRSSRCAFILGDLSVSRIHAEMIANVESVHVKDMASRNGTFVDGVRVEEAEVQLGQRMQFGNAQFQLVGDDFRADAEHDSGLSTYLVPNKPTLQPAALHLLTKAQLPVLDLLLTGLKEKEIATSLFLSRHTVHKHVMEIYRKMGVNSRAALSALFVADAKKPGLPTD
jgi:DNA-binding CsgD family transcriptional regulator